MILLIAQRGASTVYRVKLRNTDAPPRSPDHTQPVDLFAPILGDPGYMVHKTGELRYWVVGLEGAQALDPDAREIDGAQWMVVEEACDLCRVPREDPEYQRVLHETIAPLNQTVRCRKGHEFVTSTADPGRCPRCGEPPGLTTVS